MLLVYLAIVYAGCIFGALLELGRRLLLLDLEVQVLQERVYKFIRLRDACKWLQEEHTTDLMDIFELAITLEAFEHTAIPRVADHSEFSSPNARDLYKSLERSWDLIQAHGVDGDGDGGKEGEMSDEKLRRRNVVAVERDLGFTEG